MKIALDARFWNRETAGLGRYTHELIQNLAKIDHKNQYLVFVMKKDLVDFKKQIKAPNFKVIGTDIEHYSFEEQTKFKKLLKEYDYDFIHFLNFNHPITYTEPFLISIHDLTLYFFPSRSKTDFFHQMIFRKIMKHAVKKSDLIFSLTERTKKEVSSLFNIDTGKITVTYCGISSNLKRPLGKNIEQFKNKQGLKTPYLLYVGQWRPHKNLVKLIEAFKILKDKYKYNGKLVLTGVENPSWKDVSKTIQKLDLSQEIITPGFVDEKDLALWYGAAQAFVFPSVQEGFGIPPLEAMACQTPVVSSDASCMPEVLGDAAHYFDPHSAPDMAKQIDKVANDKKLQDKLVAKGLNQIKYYSWMKMAKIILKKYQEIGKNLK